MTVRESDVFAPTEKDVSSVLESAYIVSHIESFECLEIPLSLPPSGHHKVDRAQ